MKASIQSFAMALTLASGLMMTGPARAQELPFSIEQKGVCEYASDMSDVSRSLRSLYSCKHKIVLIRNVTSKTMVFDRIVLNQNKCKNHLFLDGEAEGAIKPDGKVVFATACKLTRIDLQVDKAGYIHRF